MGLKHTLDHFREEIWLKEKPTILESSTESSLVEVAKAKVREILSKHSPPPIDGDVRAEIDRIVRDCEKSML